MAAPRRNSDRTRARSGGGSLYQLEDVAESELLLRLKRQNDQGAREELITRYLPLVKSLARRFRLSWPSRSKT